MDFNGDGVVTFGDVWRWIEFIYFYPGDRSIDAFAKTRVGMLIGIGPDQYRGLVSFVMAAFVWTCVLASLRAAARRAIRFITLLRTREGRALLREEAKRRREEKRKARKGPGFLAQLAITVLGFLMLPLVAFLIVELFF